MGLPPPSAGATPFDAAAARLLNVVVAVNSEASGSVAAAVGESVATAVQATAAEAASPIEVEWLARYAVIAPDFASALQATTLARPTTSSPTSSSR
jgi:hypothetical protein